MDAILLCRISDQKQDDGYSLDAQERFGVEYCKRNNFFIRQIFRFVETGSKFNKREKFDNMMDYIREYVSHVKNKPLQLIVEKPDRLTRNFTNREQLQLFIMTGKLVIHFYKDKRILDSNCSPADIFTDDVMTSVNKYIALNIARETRKGMNEKARHGWFPGHAPLGYKNVRDGAVNKHGRKEAKILVDDDTKKAILRIFELRAMHAYSYYSIRDQILKEKLLPDKRAERFAKSSVEYILQNPFYEGKFFWDGEWHQGKHEVFVPIEWIRRVDGRRGVAHQTTFVGPFSHLISCGVEGCGSTVIYDPKTKTNKRSGDSKVYHYYHCADGKRFHKLNNIRQVNIGEGQLWQTLENLIGEITISEPVAKIISDHLLEADKKSEVASDEIRSQARGHLAALSKREEELYDHWSEGLLTKDGYKRQLEKLTHERAEAETKLESAENIGKESLEEKAKFLLELCKRAESAWKKGCADERIALMKRFCSNFRLSGVSLEFDLKKPFLKVLEFKKNTDNTKWCPGPDLNRHARLTEAQDFKSCVSTNFTTGAH